MREGTHGGTCPAPKVTRKLKTEAMLTTSLCPVRYPGDAASCPLALEFAIAGQPILDDDQPSPDTLADHGALKLTEGARNLEQQFALSVVVSMFC